MTILPAAYLPSVGYVAHLLRGGCVIDLGEHFVKRSERNRARVMTANGVMDLTVQVCNANRPCTPMREMRIDYSKAWQHQHWGTLVASYKASPYFDHYAPLFEPFYSRRYSCLPEFDLELTRMICSLLGAQMPPVCEVYVEVQPGDLDLRPRHKKDPAFDAEPYVQVFSDRMPFVPNLSFVDLLFCEGPASVSVLKHSLPEF